MQEALDDIYHQLAELNRRMNNLLLPGTAKSFDGAAGAATLDIGHEGDSHAMPAAMHDGHWNPVKAGQKMLMLCPGGDPANGVAIAFGHCDGNPAPSTRTDEKMLRHGDEGKGAALHLREKGQLFVQVKSFEKLKVFRLEDKTWWKFDPSIFLPTDEEPLK